MSYIIALGAGKNQIPYLKQAEILGYDIIAIDQNPNSLGFLYATIKIHESILNYKKIEYKIKKLILSQSIDAIICPSYGASLFTYSYLAERFKLLGFETTICELFLDKYRVRKALQSLSSEIQSFQQPNFMLATSKISKTELDKIKFPLVVKDRKGSGKQNIFYANDLVDLTYILKKSHLKDKLNKNFDDFILEQYIDAPEITVLGFVQNFKFELICITDKQVSPEAPFIELEHIFPTSLKGIEPIISEIHQKIIEKVPMTNAPIVSEWKYYDNKFYLMEISLQIPGEFLAEFILPKALHYNYFQNYLLMHLGAPIQKVNFPKKSKIYTVQYIPKKINDNELERMVKNASFYEILNENSTENPQKNMDRYAVMGMITGKKIKTT